MPDPAQTSTPNAPQQPATPTAAGGLASPIGGPSPLTGVQEPKTFTPEDIQGMQIPNEPTLPTTQIPNPPLSDLPQKPSQGIPQTPLTNPSFGGTLPPTQTTPQELPNAQAQTVTAEPYQPTTPTPYQSTPPSSPLTSVMPQSQESVQDLSSLTGGEPSSVYTPQYPEQPAQPEQPVPTMPDYNTYQTPTYPETAPTDPAQNQNWGTPAPAPYQPLDANQPPAPPQEPKKGTPPMFGFLIGGVIALIILGIAFGAYTIINKNKVSNVPTPAPSSPPTQEPVKKTPTPAPLAPTKAPTPAPTPKNAETYINSEFKYQFLYPLGLPTVTKVVSDPRFPKALDIEKLTLTQSAATTSAYIIVWDAQDDVPTYITDGQSQTIKVNIYNTIRFTLMKPGSIRETHYLTQKFENVYDIALEDGGGQISTPAFEKILSTFTFSDQLPTEGQPAPTTNASPKATTTPSATTSLSNDF